MSSMKYFLKVFLSGITLYLKIMELRNELPKLNFHNPTV